jgi:hypothetical protein
MFTGTGYISLTATHLIIAYLRKCITGLFISIFF